MEEDIGNIYTIERLEQLRALADPLRVRILEQLVHQPRTMSQLAELLGEAANKMHYHVHELEKFGFIKLVEKREHGGFLEKYYRAVAKDFRLAPNLLTLSSNNEALGAIQEIFEHTIQQVTESLERKARNPDLPETVSLSSETLWLTEEEFRGLENQITALLNPFLERQRNSKARAWHVHFIAHTLAPSGEEQEKIP